MIDEEILELLLDYADAMENAALVLKQSVAKLSDVKETVAVKEEPFLTLDWEMRKGDKLKEYEVTTKTQNSGSDNFQHCLNILQRNNAMIQNRFHDKGWRYSYWLYPQREGTIYRKVLSKK